MSKYRPFETKRARLKFTKNLARIYRQTKCRNCAVIVKPMDFAKILGKFTKVKIQYENSNSPPKVTNEDIAPISNARLKSNENGMVLIHRSAYQQHPVKELGTTKKQKVTKGNDKQLVSKVNTTKQNLKHKINATKRNTTTKLTSAKVINTETPAKAVNKTLKRPISNILKENNRLKKVAPKSPSKLNNQTPLKDRNSNYNKKILNAKSSKLWYKVTFNYPQSSDYEILNKVSLIDLLPQIDKKILPSEVWDIDYFPKKMDEPKEDKVYDRIAAELEDLMYNDKVIVKSIDGKTEEFPSIMDILNDTEMKNKINESNDVEAMLLGDSVPKTSVETEQMVVDHESTKHEAKVIGKEGSPSILEEMPVNNVKDSPEKPTGQIQNKSPAKENIVEINKQIIEEEKEDINKYLLIKKNDKMENSKRNNDYFSHATTTHVIFKRVENGKCIKLVMCPKSLDYNVELEGKSVKLRGAPKFISSLEDLRVLLEIVDETEAGSFYVLH